jgi:hypothetical protein
MFEPCRRGEPMCSPCSSGQNAGLFRADTQVCPYYSHAPKMGILFFGTSLNPLRCDAGQGFINGFEPPPFLYTPEKV